MTAALTHDVIVIGAGPAGSTAALEFARQGRTVALVEREAFPRRKVCGEFMSAANIPIFRRLGIEEAWQVHAGPEIRRVALYTGERMITAPMPGQGRSGAQGHGRALGRDVLDTLLRDAACREGADLYQPCRAVSLQGGETGRFVTLEAADGGSITLSAPVIVAAHGSWDRTSLPTGLPKGDGSKDLLGFKAHFLKGTLAPDTMPLLAFPGGYGGLVQADAGRLSLSCCIRAEALAELRRTHGGSAAEVMQAHLLNSCRGVREVLDGAELAGPWLATGSVRPAIRARYQGGIYRVGNLAGEAHPVIAEGISMAIQSASLLAAQLDGINLQDAAARDAAGRRYAFLWLRRFGPRLQVARAVAWMASRPRTFSGIAALVETMPGLLTLGAGLSGKA